MSEIVNQLKTRLAEDPKFKEAFETAFNLAVKILPELFKEFNIQTFDDYINFYDALLQWVPYEDAKAETVYIRLCLFYFVIDLPPVKFAQTPIAPQSKAPWTWLSQWLIEYAQNLGQFLNESGSLTPETLQTFYDSPPYHMQDYPKPPGGWKNFNEFFARHIDPNVRPIDSPDDQTVIVSPADSTFDGAWLINSKANVTTFDVKGVPWPISELLKDSARGTNYGDLFKGGIFTHAFLSPHDYHRQHAPVAGEVIVAEVLDGLCYLQVVVQRDENGIQKLKMVRTLEVPETSPTASLDAPDDPGYQFLQARGLILLHTDIGYVAVLPIGMAQVSSVVLSVKKGDKVTKGQELSYFQFGGSDIVVVYQAESEVQVIPVRGDFCPFGQRVATAKLVPGPK